MGQYRLLLYKETGYHGPIQAITFLGNWPI